MVEATVGERAAEALVEEQEQQRNLQAFGTESVGIATAVAFEQTMTFQFAKVVAELIQTVGFGGKLEGSEHGLVNLFGRPAAEVVPLCRRTSIRRMIRGSWIWMPG